jgi:phenylpyruvate tautomerase PptA (4-oxalocrotonate tautomerase family)
MTIMRVGMAGVKLDTTSKGNLVKRLIEEFAAVEVGQYSEPIAAGYTVQMEEIEPDNLWMGLKPAVETHPAAKAVVITAYVMAGPWNAVMKKELFSRLDGVIRDVLAIPRGDSSANVWITVTEIPGDSFCVGGKVVSIAKLSPLFTPDRQQRINEYLKQ